MHRFIFLLLGVLVGCASVQDVTDQRAQKNCGSDKNNTYVICDLRMHLDSDNAWLYENYWIIEQYKYKSNDASKITYQIITELSLNNFAYYNSASFLVDGKTYTLTPSKTEHDEQYGLREILYFDIKKDFINILAGSQNIVVIMTGKATNKYKVRSTDIPSIKEFYDTL